MMVIQTRVNNGGEQGKAQVLHRNLPSLSIIMYRLHNITLCWLNHISEICPSRFRLP